MKHKIKAVSDLTVTELEEITTLSRAVYPPDGPRDGAEHKEWSRSMWCVLIRDGDDKLVSYIGLVTRDVTCDHTDMFIGGVGGVKTHPDARGRGYAGYGLQQVGAYLKDVLKVDFSLLVCSDRLVSYYGKFGWQPFAGDMLVEQFSEKVKFTFANPMVLAGTKPIPPCNVIDLCGKPW